MILIRPFLKSKGVLTMIYLIIPIYWANCSGIMKFIMFITISNNYVSKESVFWFKPGVYFLDGANLSIFK